MTSIRSTSRRFVTFSALVAAGFLAVASGAWAQLVPVGEEIAVNSYTTGQQDLPAVAVRENGDFVVVWSQRVYGESGSVEFSVAGQRFAAGGVPIGTEFLVDQVADLGLGRAQVESLTPAGDFVVTWASSQSVGSDFDGSVQARIFDSAATPAGAQFQVNSSTTGDQYPTAVAGAEDGSFAILWGESTFGSTAHSDGSGAGIFAARFGSDGAPVGTEFVANSYTTGEQRHGDLDMRPDGSFVVAWTSYEHPGGSAGPGDIFARAFDSTGVPLGPQIAVNTDTEGTQADPGVVALEDGGSVITWQRFSPSNDPTDIRARRFDSGGAAQGDEFTVNPETTVPLALPAISEGPQGGFVVAWTVNGFVGDPGNGLFARSFASGGQPIDDAFRLNTFTGSNGFFVDLAATPDGGQVATWSVFTLGGQPSPDGDGDAVRARILAPVCMDDDGDGYGTGGSLACAAGTAIDCDDSDPAVNPGAAEIPGNGLDDDCDPSTPTGCGAEMR